MQPAIDPPPWHSIAGNFAWDGGMLIDLHLHGPAEGGWNGLVKAIREGHSARFWMNAAEMPVPESYAPIAAAIKAEANPYLELHLGAVKICAHFFTDEELELSLDRGQIGSAAAYGLLCSFMRDLGRSIGWPVSLSPENMPAHAFLTYHPADERWSFFECAEESAGDDSARR